jgi:hypothetical protein
MKSLSFLTLSIFTLSTFLFIADTASASSGCTIPLDELNTGKYYYMNDRSYSVVFDIQLNQVSDSGTFTGTITEENTFQENAGPILNANVAGECR